MSEAIFGCTRQR